MANSFMEEFIFSLLLRVSSTEYCANVLPFKEQSGIHIYHKSLHFSGFSRPFILSERTPLWLQKKNYFVTIIICQTLFKITFSIPCIVLNIPFILNVSSAKFTNALGNPFNSSIKKSESNAIQGFFTSSYILEELYIQQFLLYHLFQVQLNYNYKFLILFLKNIVAQLLLYLYYQLQILYF